MPDFSLEASATQNPVCGIDEAGRGPWAGPVVAAAVIYPPTLSLPSLDDSKKLSKSRRESLYETLVSHVEFGVGIASAEEIDAHNILRATLLAMQRAVLALPRPPAFALVDGTHPPALACPVRCVVKGDSKSLSIAAASVIAKVTRDRMMTELAQHYPNYGFEQHAGYGTLAHQRALAEYGACPAHRKSFAPIKQRLSA